MSDLRNPLHCLHHSPLFQLSAIASIPPPEKMTMQMYNHYFPEAAINPNRANPGFAPHHLKSAQMDLMDQYYNTSRNSRYVDCYRELLWLSFVSLYSILSLTPMTRFSIFKLSMDLKMS
jgi:hypothetical protein